MEPIPPYKTKNCSSPAYYASYICEYTSNSVNSNTRNMLHSNNVLRITYIITDLMNAVLGNSSVSTIHHATIEEAVFPVDPTDALIHCLDNNHVICVYSRSMSVPLLFNESHELSSERIGTRSTEEDKRSACEDLTCALKTVCVL
jgi:hypothetical protein